MALEYVIDFPCRPKSLLAGPDAPEEGARRLLGLWKLQGIADAVRRQAETSGQNPDDVRIQLMVARAGEETVPTAMNLAEIETQTESLRSFAPDCSICPVSPNGRLAGCIGGLPYPIPISAEQWLLDRLAPADSAGGFLLLNAIRDFRYDGAITRTFRAKKLFESSVALVKPLPANEFDAAEISTDALFHAILGVGPVLAPWHMAMVLVWFQALALDGAPIGNVEAFDALVNLPVDARAERAAATLGPPSADAGVLAIQRLFLAMHSAWCRDASIRLDG